MSNDGSGLQPEQPNDETTKEMVLIEKSELERIHKTSERRRETIAKLARRVNRTKNQNLTTLNEMHSSLLSTVSSQENRINWLEKKVETDLGGTAKRYTDQLNQVAHDCVYEVDRRIGVFLEQLLKILMSNMRKKPQSRRGKSTKTAKKTAKKR